MAKTNTAAANAAAEKEAETVTEGTETPEVAETTTAAKGRAKAAGSKGLFANLIFGKIFYFKGKRFEYNKPVLVNKEVAEYLKKSKVGIDKLTSKGTKKTTQIARFAVGPIAEDLIDKDDEEEVNSDPDS